MGHVRIGALALVVAAGFSGAAATLASAAAPEFGRCVKVGKGNGQYSGSNCTKESTGGIFSWTPLAGGVQFTSGIKEGSLATIETVIDHKVLICSGETSSGEYTGPKTVGHLVIILTGCEIPGLKCSSPGEPEGTVRTVVLEGILGVQLKGTTALKDKVAMSYFAAGDKGGQVTEWRCGGLIVKVRGEVLSALTTNKMKTMATDNFLAKKAKNKPEQFEGGPIETLEATVGGGPYEQTGLILSSFRTNAEAVEVNTVF